MKMPILTINAVQLSANFGLIILVSFTYYSWGIWLFNIYDHDWTLFTIFISLNIMISFFLI